MAILDEFKVLIVEGFEVTVTIHDNAINILIPLPGDLTLTQDEVSDMTPNFLGMMAEMLPELQRKVTDL